MMAKEKPYCQSFRLPEQRLWSGSKLSSSDSFWIKVPVMEKVCVCCMGLECVGGASTPQTQILPFTFALKDRHAQNSDCISVLQFF